MATMNIEIFKFQKKDDYLSFTFLKDDVKDIGDKKVILNMIEHLCSYHKIEVKITMEKLEQSLAMCDKDTIGFRVIYSEDNLAELFIVQKKGSFRGQ
ncbi:hypothetical protein [Clostridium psychrophilum]|uniref:hypothetical protein n=1 Tax=Clostridium psychrophilum TaxID=132926 RepID=UPI001C0B9D14|nr:hypothetical protein [Clostridium psychrophilum]MBU3182629.1 hypothetical protein [Clostridium psychrophilum]